MGEKEVYKEVIYEEKSIIIKSTIFAIVLFLLFTMISGKDIDLLVALTSITIIIGSFTAIFLTISTLSLYDEGYFKTLLIVYSINIILSLIYFLNISSSQEVSFKIEINKVEVLLIANLITSLSLIFPITYLRGKEFYLKSIYSGSLVVIFTIIFNLSSYEWIRITGILICTYLLYVKYLIYLKGFKFKIGSKINYMKINVYFFIIIETIIALKSIFRYDRFYMLPIALFMIVLFMITFVAIVDRLINDPYKVLFNSLYEETNKLNKINKELNQSNSELERGQIIIKRKEKMFQLFFSKAPVALVIVNDSNNRIIYSNKNFLKLLEISSFKEIANKKLDILIQINEGSYSEEKDIFYSGEVYVSGKKRYLEIETVERNEEGNQRTLLVYDSTEKIKIERTKEKIRKEILEEEIKREFLSNITHDLKTPINVIYSATQLEKILIENKNLDEIAKYNFLGKQNCRSLISLTNNLIDSSKMSSNYMNTNFKLLNIVEIIENTVQSLVEYAKLGGVDIIFDTNVEEIYCNIDEEFLIRIVTNLLSNSIKFTDELGEIHVVIESLQDGWVRIEIRDNGIGMDDYFLKIAFERYSMNRDEGSRVTGTGIGLFVVKKFVDLLGGHIKIDSEIGVGTKIEMFFKVEKGE